MAYMTQRDFVLSRDRLSTFPKRKRILPHVSHAQRKPVLFGVYGRHMPNSCAANFFSFQENK